MSWQHLTSLTLGVQPDHDPDELQVVLGKPSKYMFEIVQRRHPGIQPARTLMIGDRWKEILASCTCTCTCTCTCQENLNPQIKPYMKSNAYPTRLPSTFNLPAPANLQVPSLRANTDILLGKNCGLQTLMVGSGVHSLTQVTI